MATKKPRMKTYGTIKESGWVWKSVSWHIYGPWAEELAEFLKDNGLHVIVKEKRFRNDGREYHVFVPEHELAPVPGLIGRFADR